MLLCGLHCFANYQERINGCYIAAAVNIANAEIKAAGNGRCNNPKGHAKHGEGVGRSYNTVAVSITEKAVLSGDSAVFGNVDTAAVPTGENITIMRRCSRRGNVAAVFNGDFGDRGAVESVNECNSVNID